MFYRKPLSLAAALGLALSAPLSAQDVAGDAVVATVGETEITIAHMAAMLGTLSTEQQQLPMDVIFEGVLERLIQQEAVSQSQPDLSKATRLRLENERRALIASEIVNQIAADVVVTDAAVQGAYDNRFADFTPSKEYNASHILVATEDEALAIIEDLNDGADFAALAREKSTGPSGPGGGSLGWFGLGRMVPAFEAAVVTMEAGEVSAPVQTQFGWHVIRLDETRQPGVPALDEVRAELEQEVWRETLAAKVEALVQTTTIERADLSGIDPAVLTDPSILAD